MRWIFLLLNCASALLVAGALVSRAGTSGASVLLVLPLQAGLCARWLREHKGWEPSWEWDVLEGLAFAAIGWAAGSPLIILIPLFARLCARGLAVSGRRLLVIMTALLGSFVGAIALASPEARASHRAVEYVFLATGFPLAALVMHLLKVSLEQTATLGQELNRERSFRLLFEMNPEPMWVHDPQTLEFLEVNSATVAKYGYGRDELLAMRVTDLEPSDAPRLPPALQYRGDGVPAVARPVLRRNLLKSGREILVEISSRVERFRGRVAVIVLARDVTEQKALVEQLRHQALHDPLTQLPNRTLLTERVEHAVARAARGRSANPVMLVVDLDGFKTVNDTLGHSVGDEVIVSVGRRLLKSLRETDTPARLGGDEFAILLEDAGDIEDAVGVAERILGSFQEPFRESGREITIGASIGIASWRKGHSGMDDLVRDADVAMYAAKATGDGCAVFDPAVHSEMVDRLRLQDDLPGALDRGELFLVYHPQIDLRSRRVVGVEALIRWRHPVVGVVGPDRFIPAAEQLGLITRIDMWVLHTACVQLRRWMDADLPQLRVAVNFSGRDLEGENFVEDVVSALSSTQIEPWMLAVELTEGTAMRQQPSAIKRLQALRAKGVRVAVDDFGTGYSMLSRIRELPLDDLKIDRSFVSDIGRDDDAVAIVRSTVAMGHSLGLTLVAEGVQSAHALELLTAIGCDGAQGHHISEPLPAEDLARWLARRGRSGQPALARETEPGGDGGSAPRRSGEKSRTTSTV